MSTNKRELHARSYSTVRLVTIRRVAFREWAEPVVTQMHCICVVLFFHTWMDEYERKLKHSELVEMNMNGWLIGFSCCLFSSPPISSFPLPRCLFAFCCCAYKRGRSSPIDTPQQPHLSCACLLVLEHFALPIKTSPSRSMACTARREIRPPKPRLSWSCTGEGQ